jgi:hypothetical protein
VFGLILGEKMWDLEGSFVFGGQWRRFDKVRIIFDGEIRNKSAVVLAVAFAKAPASSLRNF